MVSNGSIAQQTDSLFKKSLFFYENEEYQMAIPVLNKHIDKFPTHFEAIELRGKCYLKTGQDLAAKQDFLKVSGFTKNESGLLYNLGIVYDRLLNSDSAIFYFKKYILQEPSRPEGYIRLSILYMYSTPELTDSAIYYAGKAVHADPENPVNYNFLAMAYYSNNKHKSALETAMRGIAIDSSISILYRTAGISSFFLKEYDEAILYFDKAYKLNPEEFTLLDYKIQTILLQNTKPEQFTFPLDGEIAFTGISSGSMDKITASVKDEKSDYFYNTLQHKFRNTPYKMSLDEFYIFYIGNSFQEGYNPFKKPAQEDKPLGDLNDKAKELEDWLFRNPTDFPLYLNLADIYLEMDNREKYFENRFKYFGFTESIKASGNGTSPEKAFLVTDVNHEYNLMVSLGYKVKGQKRIELRKQHFDLLSGTDENNNEVLIYFNIDKPLSIPNGKRKN